MSEINDTQRAILAAVGVSPTSFAGGPSVTLGLQTITLASIVPNDNDAIAVFAYVIAQRSDVLSAGAASGYALFGVFNKVAGTVTQVGTTVQFGVREDDAGLEAILDASGGTIRVRVTGVTLKNYNWQVKGGYVNVPVAS